MSLAGISITDLAFATWSIIFPLARHSNSRSAHKPGHAVAAHQQTLGRETQPRHPEARSAGGASDPKALEARQWRAIPAGSQAPCGTSGRPHKGAAASVEAAQANQASAHWDLLHDSRSRIRLALIEAGALTGRARSNRARDRISPVVARTRLSRCQRLPKDFGEGFFCHAQLSSGELRAGWVPRWARRGPLAPAGPPAGPDPAAPGAGRLRCGGRAGRVLCAGRAGRTRGVAARPAGGALWTLGGPRTLEHTRQAGAKAPRPQTHQKIALAFWPPSGAHWSG